MGVVIFKKQGEKTTMEVVDRINTQEQVEKLTEEQRDDLFTKLVMGKDVTENIETSQGLFIVKYPKSADLLTIGKIAAVRRNYKPIEAFDAETEMINTITSTLDVVVVSGPKWLEDARKANQNFSFLEVPSRVFLAELYGKAYSFREKVEQRINQDEGSADKRIPSKESDDGPVDGGAFGGLSSE
jgi:elongation factor P--beta-lysine ligase